MEIEHVHRLVDEKKWTLVLRQFDILIAQSSDVGSYESLIWIFENIDQSFREKNAQHHYLVMWKVAFKSGKIKLAKKYAEFILDYLIEYKRIPALKKLIVELSSEGLLKDSKKQNLIDFILGKKKSSTIEDSQFFELHPEMWKDSRSALKGYLLDELSWEISHWKLAYEYILKFFYDRDIFVLLADKAIEFKKNNHNENFVKYFQKKKIDYKSFRNNGNSTGKKSEKANLNIDYDQLTLDIMSGVLEPNILEQRKILITINELSNEELLVKGSDMVVAFGLLGMDIVVVRLCERMLPLLTDVKKRASLFFMKTQSLFNSSEYYQAIDVVDDVLTSEPLLDEEMIAFNYIKAECFLKLKKYKNARELFLRIKEINPHYRLVVERLRHIEEIK